MIVDWTVEKPNQFPWVSRQTADVRYIRVDKKTITDILGEGKEFKISVENQNDFGIEEHTFTLIKFHTMPSGWQLWEVQGNLEIAKEFLRI